MSSGEDKTTGETAHCQAILGCKMRIAVSGTHFSGKSALVEALSRALLSYDTIEEPYHPMEEEGYMFGQVPLMSLEDIALPTAKSAMAVEASDLGLTCTYKGNVRGG